MRFLRRIVGFYYLYIYYIYIMNVYTGYLFEKVQSRRPDLAGGSFAGSTPVPPSTGVCIAHHRPSS